MAERIVLHRSKNDLTQEQLIEYLRYDSDTGHFYWRKTTNRSARAGNRAGTPDKHGYIVITLWRVHYYAHRLAWFYMTGKWPENEIDHKNLSPADNRWRNIREASHGQNQQNQRRAKSHNRSGLLGAFGVSGASTFMSRIVIDGKKIRLGHFPTAEAAHRAYLKAKRELHPYGEIAKA